jgi:hypothetical protein
LAIGVGVKVGRWVLRIGVAAAAAWESSEASAGTLDVSTGAGTLDASTGAGALDASAGAAACNTTSPVGVKVGKIVLIRTAFEGSVPTICQTIPSEQTSKTINSKVTNIIAIIIL